MGDDYPASLKGHILMAMPGLSDPNFAQTVTCICEHNADGAMGIIVNRLHEGLFAKDIFEELAIACSPERHGTSVHAGGPVHAGELFVLHGVPPEWEATLRVTPSLGVSNTRDILEAIAGGRGPAAFLISLGCAGWGPGQLEAEIKENAWLTQPADEDVLFRLPVEVRWEEALKKIGVDPMLLSDTPGHA
jgi:putative transcriptional regulator